MGYLTTITFRNDSFHDLAKDPQAVVLAIQAAMAGNPIDDERMISQMPVHSHDSAVYVSRGNTCVELTAYTRAQTLMTEHRTFFGELYEVIGDLYADLTKRWAKIK